MSFLGRCLIHGPQYDWPCPFCPQPHAVQQKNQEYTDSIFVPMNPNPTPIKPSREWVVEYRSKCGCTALREPVDCGQGFKVIPKADLDRPYEEKPLFSQRVFVPQLLEALETVKAAIGDRLSAGGPLSKNYAHKVLETIEDALALRPPRATVKKTIEEIPEARMKEIADGYLSAECTDAGRRLFMQGVRMGARHVLKKVDDLCNL